ncbi:MAG TPA: hypothetical protein VE998_04955 [Terriglobales bacterium]|nr:hypothetical protein [Terriglobales bacterium]
MSRFAPFLRLPFVVLSALLVAAPSIAQQRGEGQLITAAPQGITPEEIIQRFAAKEKQFAQARERYTYKESVIVQTLEGDTVDGEYRQSWDINFDDQGNRTTQVTYAPMSTLTRVQMTEEDLHDIQNLMPFVLTTDEIPEYNINYVGQQREDELQTYVFDVSPKRIEKKKRYFEGRIWVDNHDFQIVMTRGKSVPDIRSKSNENLFPRFTTYREQVDNVYWFPTYTRADDDLHFQSGDVHIRVIVRYTNYKRFGSESHIVFNGQTVEPGSQPPAGAERPQGGGSAQPPGGGDRPSPSAVPPQS